MRDAPVSIIGIDLGKESLGAAFGDGTAPPTTIREKFIGDRAEAGWRFSRWLDGLIRVERPRLVMLEAPFTHTGAKTSVETARLMLGFAFVAGVVCHEHGVRCHECRPEKWRKSILGRGRPGNPKREMLAFCRRLGWQTGNVHDRAEAAGVWAYAHLCHGYGTGIARLFHETSTKGAR